MSIFSKLKYMFKPRPELPIPSHLKDYLIPMGNGNDEYEVTGKIRCHCKNDEFEVYESNDRNIIKLVCKKCKKALILFDSGKHGWNGFVCHDDFLDRTLPFEQYHCEECSNDSFKVNVHISSQGKEDFIEECVSNDSSFSPKNWIDGFEWISISLTCKNCGNSESEWADIETM